METEIDYRELLRKYMDHVAECGGTTFVGGIWLGVWKGSEAEWAELIKVATNGD